MKKVKIGLGVFLAAIFIGSFFLSTVHAQGVDYTIWEGTWLKVGTNFKGYERNFAGPPDWLPANERFTVFVNIFAWNDPDATPNSGDEFFNAMLWVYDYGAIPPAWQSMPIALNYIHGTPLDLLIWSQNDQGDITTGTGERLAFSARIKGTMDRTGTFLQTATFKCLGGYFVEMDPADPIYQAAGVTMTGTLIPATFCNSLTNQQYPPCQIR